MEPVSERNVQVDSVLPADGRRPCTPGGRITVGSVPLKIDGGRARGLNLQSALKRAFEIDRFQSCCPVFDRRAIWL